jgi:collagenase-like PrtC family protease
MNTNIKEYDDFLKKYHSYIDNIYMSLPLGDRFHGRNHIAQQFKQKEKVDLFWELVKMIQSYGINVEVVFNTHLLKDDDLLMSRDELEKHNVNPQKIGILDMYYEMAKEIYPDADLINSVNNMPDTFEGMQKLKGKYEEIVIGRQHTRNSDMFEFVKKTVGSKVVLLINNGCSHTCMGCREVEYCKKVYERDVQKYSPEFLYALQSIMPYELHDNYFDFSNVDYFKISNRNADTEYTIKCLDSYINNNAECYLAQKKENYFLWARLMWHMKYYDSFNYDSIKEMKKEIAKK